jgi:hypothetical protein
MDWKLTIGIRETVLTTYIILNGTVVSTKDCPGRKVVGNIQVIDVMKGEAVSLSLSPRATCRIESHVK